MHSKGVLVQVGHPKFGSAKGSGLLLNNNIVIAHGAILLPMCLVENDFKNVKNMYNTFLKELVNSQCLFSRPKPADKNSDNSFKFKILSRVIRPLSTDQKSGVSSDSHNNLCRSETEEKYYVQDATLCLIHSYDNFSGGKLQEEISNWTMFNKDRPNDQKSLFSMVLPKFFILMIGEPSIDLFENTMKALLKKSKHMINLHPGTPVVIESTPFGNFSFMSSWSHGIISKIINDHKDGFLTDTRLVFGCEGAPIYLFKDGAKDKLIGMVLHTLTWCSGDGVGFSMGINIYHFVKSILNWSSKGDFIPLSNMQLDTRLKFNQLNMDHLSSAVVFIRAANKWGSGVVVDSSQGVILTCAHVVQHARDSVKVICKQGKFKATTLFCSPLNEPLDLAVLSVGKIAGLKQMNFAEKPAVLGETVFTAGYPLTTESLVAVNTTPTLSSGCVSKISLRGGPLQTTCCTQSGVSGGAVFRPPDQLLGIAASNLKYEKTAIPSFGIAVSVEDFKTPVMQYLRTKDPSSLQSLHVESYKIRMEWLLQDSKL